MRYNSHRFHLDVMLRTRLVTAYDIQAPERSKQLSSLDPAAIGKAMWDAAAPKLPFSSLPTPQIPFPGQRLAQAVGAPSEGNMERTSARVTAISDGYEARFSGTSPTADFFDPASDIDFSLVLSSRPPYYSADVLPNPEHALLIAPWQDPEMLGQAVLNIFAMAGPPVNKGTGSVFDPPASKRRLALHRAAASGRPEDLPARKPRNVNTADTGGMTPLMLAAGAGHQEVAARLLDWSADHGLQDHRGQTPLHHAAAGGHEVVIGTLLAAGADPSQVDHDGSTALHLAAGRGHAETAARLLEGGAPPNIGDNLYASTPLHLAVRGNYQTLLPLLAGAGADVNAGNEAGRTPLHVAAAYGHPELVRELIAAGADVNRPDLQGETPLHRPAFYQHMECLAALVAAGADPGAPDHEGNVPLHVAARMNRDRAVRLLLEAGANMEAVNAEAMTALDLAISNGHDLVNHWQGHLEGVIGTSYEHNSEAVTELLEHGASLDPLRMPVGDRHALWPHLTPADLLLSTGDLDYARLPGLPDTMKKRLPLEDTYGNSPLSHTVTWNSLLHDAVIKDLPQLVKTLLQEGASPTTAVRHNFPPLHLAAGLGNREMVDLLLEWGADLEVPWTNALDGRYDSSRRTWQYLQREFPELEYDATMGRISGSTRTALDEAVRRGQVAMVRHLLERGAVPWPDPARTPHNWGIPPDAYSWIVSRGHTIPWMPDSYEQLLSRQLTFYDHSSEMAAMVEVFRDFGLIT